MLNMYHQWGLFHRTDINLCSNPKWLLVLYIRNSIWVCSTRCIRWGSYSQRRLNVFGAIGDVERMARKKSQFEVVLYCWWSYRLNEEVCISWNICRDRVDRCWTGVNLCRRLYGTSVSAANAFNGGDRWRLSLLGLSWLRSTRVVWGIYPSFCKIVLLLLFGASEFWRRLGCRDRSLNHAGLGPICSLDGRNQDALSWLGWLVW